MDGIPELDPGRAGRGDVPRWDQARLLPQPESQLRGELATRPTTSSPRATSRLNAGRATATLEVSNTGDRPIQVGSHAHFFEVNRALRFDRVAAFGMRLDIPAGTAVRFEPGQSRR